jgi:hypothetical protein
MNYTKTADFIPLSYALRPGYENSPSSIYTAASGAYPSAIGATHTLMDPISDFGIVIDCFGFNAAPTVALVLQAVD